MSAIFFSAPVISFSALVISFSLDLIVDAFFVLFIVAFALSILLLALAILSFSLAFSETNLDMENGKEQIKTSILSEISKDALFQKLVSENRITSVHSSEPTLSDIFMELTRAQLD